MALAFCRATAKKSDDGQISASLRVIRTADAEPSFLLISTLTQILQP